MFSTVNFGARYYPRRYLRGALSLSCVESAWRRMAIGRLQLVSPTCARSHAEVWINGGVMMHRS
eukprot:6162247-Pleurochrysis_carterae.AAC.2